jgi:Kelch motif protein
MRGKTISAMIICLSLVFATTALAWEVELLSNDFETGWNGWTTDNYYGAGYWRLDNPGGLTPAGFASTFASLDSNFSGQWEWDYLRSTTFDNTGCESLSLELDLCSDGSMLFAMVGYDYFYLSGYCGTGYQFPLSVGYPDPNSQIQFLGYFYPPYTSGTYAAIDNVILNCVVPSLIFLEADAEVKSGGPGQTITYDITVTNDYPDSQVVAFDYASDNGWTYNGPTELTLAGGETRHFDLTADIPSDYPPVVDDMTITATPTPAAEDRTLDLMTHISWYSGTPMPTPLFGHGAVYDGDQYFYIVGGAASADSIGLVEDALLRYEVATDTWNATLSPLPGERFGGGACFMNDRIYYVGGTDGDGDAMDAVYGYNIAADAWATLAPLPELLPWTEAICDPDLNRVWVIAGYDEFGDASNAFYYYDVAGDAWHEPTGLISSLLPVAQPEMRGRYHEGLIDLAGGGLRLRYETATDSWRLLQGLGEPHYGHAFDLYGRLFVVAGGAAGGMYTDDWGWYWYWPWGDYFDSAEYWMEGSGDPWETFPISFLQPLAGVAGGMDKDGVFYLFGGQNEWSEDVVDTTMYFPFGAEFCTGCLVDESCWADGDQNPNNPCLICDAVADPNAWSNNDGVSCDDNEYCNGADTCLAGACTENAGTPCPDDGVWCNGDETCDEDTDACGHENAPACPDDSVWCNGAEFCDEVADACGHRAAPDCADDGLWCTGTEFCDEDNDECAQTGTPCPDDSLWCNGDELCDEDTDTCGHENAPDCSDDGMFCTGEESCDEDNDECVSSGDPCEDDELFCTGEESCDEDIDECVSSGDPCEDDELFCTGEESCDEDIDECVSSGDPCEDDELFCTGEESCDEENGECVSSGDPCEDDELFCTGEESCDEENGECVSSGDPCEDDGLFCTGDESCDEEIGECLQTGNPCAEDEVCDEENQDCVTVSSDDDTDGGGIDLDDDDDAADGGGDDDDDGGSSCGC